MYNMTNIILDVSPFKTDNCAQMKQKNIKSSSLAFNTAHK